MKIIVIIIIVVIVLGILIRDHICFTKDENDDNDTIPPGYHVGDW